MLEMLINPKKAERKSWEMFFIGAFYGFLSLLLVRWLFYGDKVFSKYSSILVITFTVIFSMPFVYYIFKIEEEKDIKIKTKKNLFLKLLFDHRKAIFVFMYLFFGFLVAYSFWYIGVDSGSNSFKAQIETYCNINPGQFGSAEKCVSKYIHNIPKTTAFSTSSRKFFEIFSNNIYVLILTLIFSLILGAGAIFILSWNASVIASAIGIYVDKNISKIPLGFGRYMIHGIFEIGGYFVGALAGGIISMAIIKHDVHSEKFWIILQDSLDLVIASVIILFIAALIEVFITPILF